MDRLQTILLDLKAGRIGKAEALRLLGTGQTARDAEVLLFAANWRAKPLAKPCAAEGTRVLLLSDQLGSVAGARPLRAGAGDALSRFEACAVQLLAEIKDILAREASRDVLLQVIVPVAEEGMCGLVGMLQAAQKENPRIRAQLLALEAGADVAAMADAERGQTDTLVSYRGAVRQVMCVEETPAVPAEHPWREDGLYLITGGAGGLGMLLARDILRQAAQARVILVGRSVQPAQPLAQRMFYRRLDVADADAVHACLVAIREEFGALNGILHCAGVLRDGFLLHKKEDDLRAVMAPKVRGLVNLDRASSADRLDLFVAFSSLAAATGSVGQADYALANAFMDHYVDHCAGGQKRILSINWPLWIEGGMRVDPAIEEVMREETGLSALATDAGLQAFYRAVAGGARRVLVAAGERDKILTLLNPPVRSASAPMPRVASLATLETLKTLFAACAKLPVAQLDVHEPLQGYGIDSIMITRLNQKLAAQFGALPKTLFYEHRTLSAVADYLNAHHAALHPAEESASRSATQHPLATLGSRGRQPHARTRAAFWENLKAGRDSITEIPEERWPLEGFFEAEQKQAVAQGKSYAKWGGFIDGFADFDPLFFGISPREAQCMDPQERLFIESCWEVLEDAALSKEAIASEYRGHVGVFAGITKTGFSLYGPPLWRDGKTLHPRTSFSSVANRVSYLFDLNGPSLPVDTMCSSSLTAIHQACEALRGGDCELAIAGGVNLYLHPSSYVELSAAHMLSADGRCRSFGQDGDGFVPGEGVGCVLLKPLARAIADGDQIHAVIRGTYINHGGKTHGYTVPNPGAQRELIRAALDKAGVDARSISYVEAHGTGTEMGDPIEIAGLTEAFRVDTPDVGFCAIGSAKSNIGHLEAAAGIAGLTKIVLQLKHGQLVPSLHARIANEHIDFARSPFVLQQTLAPWPRGGLPLRAAISSFGAGGANAHVVLEEYVDQRPVTASQEPAAIVLSARTEEALRARAAQLLAWLGRAGAAPDATVQAALQQRLASLLHVDPRALDPELPVEEFGVDRLHLAQLQEEFSFAGSLQDCPSIAAMAARIPGGCGVNLTELAYTLQTGREAMAYRLGCVATSAADLAERLERFLAGDASMLQFAQLGQTRQRAEAQNAAAISSVEPGQMLARWLQGQSVDWRSPYKNGVPRRISLPSYPFARNRYWIGEQIRQERPAAASVAVEGRATSESITQTIVDKLCAALDLQPGEIRGDQSFADYGLDSILGVNLVDDLNAAFGIALDTTSLFDYSTVDRLSALIQGQCKAPVAPVAVAQAATGLDPIAIIGISGRFPQSDNPQQLWQHLAAGRDLVEPVSRWPLADDGGCRHGGFVDGIDEFDPLFFNISGLEASYMDPQQRVFLQEAWKALEDAGYAGTAVAGRACGVYVGCCGGDYQDLFLGKPSAQSLWGNMASVIPSRIAYYLDLKGPALAVDTACSSSLVALDLACKDLRNGEIEMALAGGVFLQATPKLYISANRAGMLSPSGRCHAFAAQADGFVPGEGAAVLVLKRLSEAQADGDHIYGVIRGSGVNQDGATNGITAPSAKSQEALLRRVYQRFGVDAAAIQMLEAHGTGTRLGDPIEFSALSKAFRAATERRQYCALGSVKSNIGHSQYAAGVAGVLKILLSLQHRQIPPSLHFHKGNPAIAFSDSPFFVNTALRPWPEGGRLAAVSSFGAGGTNAHVVIGEAPATVRQHDSRPAWLVVLSARTAAQLQLQAAQLLEHCRQNPTLDLGNLSFTLLSGRKHFEQRLAVVAEDLEELQTALAAASIHALPAQPRAGATQAAASQVWEQCVTRLPAAPSLRVALEELAAAFLEGATASSAGLFGDGHSRLPLPTYPFARDRYWIEERRQVQPLLQKLGERRFGASFTGSEFFLADHKVQGQAIMPGVVALEMARAALADGLGRDTGIRVGDVVWLRPLAGPAPEVVIALGATEGERLAFRICDAADAERVYTQGFVEPLTASAPRQELDALRSACALSVVSREQCYAAIRAMGIEHGARLQAVQEIHVGAGLALARLELSAADADADALVLHPGMMDSAIQASVGLLMGRDKSALPFALQRVDIYAPCTTRMWAVIHLRAASALESLDIDVCDDSGAVCVRMVGYSSRVLEQEAPQASPSGSSVLLQPVWDVQELSSPVPFSGRMLVVGAGPDVLRQLAPYAPQVLACDDSIAQIATRLAALADFDHIVWIGADAAREAPGKDGDAVIGAFRLIKALLGAGHDALSLRWTVITRQCQPVWQQDTVLPADAGLHGLFGSLAKEYPNWPVRIADVEAGGELPLAAIFGLPFDARGDAWALRNAQWYRRVLLPLAAAAAGPTRYRKGGVYVVIGGAGGVGALWTDYMVSRYQASVVWIGRSAPDAALQARLAGFGGAVSYICADATDRAALLVAQAQIESKLGPVHGVVHSAIVLLDQGLARMDEQRFAASYRAKAEISVCIAEVFCRHPLDFVLFFSSIQSFAKMPGQSNYAAGCTFQDAFAHHLGQQGGTPVKVMNWGYWGKVGIVAGEHYQQRMAQAGLASLDAPAAMAALESLLAGSIDQLALVKTTRLAAIDGIDMSQGVEVYPQTLQPCIAEIGRSFRPQQAQVDSIRARVGEQMSEMDTLLARLLFAQLSEIGLFAGQDIAAMRAQLPPLYARWFDESLVVLRRHGWIDAAGGAARAVDAAAWSDWEREKAPWMHDDNRRAQVVLVEIMLRALPDILKGQRLATDAMFPQSSLKLVEGIYKNNLVADYFNEVLLDVLLAYVGKRLAQDPAVRLRILEVGAGTGGTSARAFAKLRPYQQHIEEYCYTDLSKAFLMHAQREYGEANPYLSYKLFNVGKPLAGQDIAAGAFDIVIATNVLHATRNIRTTLRNAKAAMRCGGLLLLNELSDNVLFSHLTFGLLEGWWLYDDAALRILGSPGLYPEAWRAVLAQEGFSALAFPAEAAHVMGQQIIIGESDGVVRQAIEIAPAPVPARLSSPPPASRPASPPQAATVAVVATLPSAPRAEAVRDRARVYFRELVGETIRIPAGEIEASAPLERYGIDSILVVQLTSRLRSVLSNISSTLFFEVQSIDGLIDHLLATQPQALAALLGVTAPAAAPAQPVQALPELPGLPISPRQTASATQDIAIIGLSGRYPQAGNVERFWQNLCEGRNCITEIPPERWNWRDYFDAEPGKSGAMYSKFGGFLDGIGHFDPLFFHISPAEAERMDPQERLFLQQAYSAIEDAGYTPANLGGQGRVGVFVGVMNGRYPTGAAFWSVANRVSYLLNLTGPSLSVDTACSSSLTALHLAVESINSGMSDCAIAGGVNLVVDPQHFVTLSEMVMLSPSDRCKPFGEGADGFIDGEAVVALVLKPLAKAVADGDQVYGIIKGSAINNGGKTNSYTVPNPLAQSRVVQDACERAGVAPRSISYIEAHGTGTALGDPIEIAGLTRAFRASTDDLHFCAIGSVKSNIGHCESAAGMAGITKVLLQFRHGQLAPSLHADSLNPQIDFANSPFVVQTALAPWKRPLIDAQEQPRRAGVSSFGAGGANAHVVLEEFAPAQRVRVAAGALPILLSARSEERLRVLAGNLLDFLAEHPDTELADLSFTLQVGRVMMDHRLALLADTLGQVQDKLRAYLSGGVGFLAGPPDGKRDRTAIYDDDAEMRRTFAAWAAQGQYEKLLGLWVRGADIAWAELSLHAGARRISLPTYPFAEEYYWIARTERRDGTATLHPLLHVNSSNLDGLRFTSSFSGKEFFLADHRVEGQCLLPGVAYLEMARAAVASMGRAGDEQIVLSNVVWAQPFAVGAEPCDLHLGLSPQEGGGLAFRIYSDAAQHSQGLARYVKNTVPAGLDLAALQSRMTRARFSPRQYYAAFEALGIAYGPAHRCIESVYAGAGEALARLALPAGTGAFVLHPGLMDSALQSSLALLLDDDGILLDPMPMLPFALAQLEILAPCEEVMWAWIAPSAGAASGAVQKLDITLCNDSGQVCIRLLGFAARRLVAAAVPGRVPVPVPAAAAPAAGVLHERTKRYLKTMLAAATRLAAERIGEDTAFEEYGLDSVMVIKLTGELEKTFGPLSKTLFFEYQTLSALAEYFVATQATRLAGLFGTAGSAVPAASLRSDAQPGRERAAAPGGESDVAIVGLSGRYPMAPSLAQFWANLRDGIDCITEVPAERWDHSLYFDPDNTRGGSTNSKWGGFLDGVDLFDPLFFNIAPRDAEIIDPQERLFLEAAYHAVEDAGYTRQALAEAGHDVGVFVGVMYEEYQLYGAEQTALGRPMALSGSPSSIANRVSYFLDLHGPSMAVDTMCSSSLTALHLACQSLLQGDCALAIAGGVNLTLHPNKYLNLGQGKFASSKGRCESFGEGGDGYVPAEGVGAVLLKPLAQAIADGDHIYGLIRGSAVNHGGKTNAYTVPNPQAQAAVVTRALHKAGIAARSVSYIEAHGTGTALGDPIEIAGLCNSFFADTADKGFCAIGSAKSNIGHCESAAGIAGLTKVLLQLKHRQLVPSLHSKTLNANIDFASTPFVVQQNLAPWQRPRLEIDGVPVEVPLRAGISSFGAGGANAHVLVEEYVAAGPVTAAEGPAVIVLSAKSAAQLGEVARNLLAHLDAEQPALQDLAYTLQVGREAMDERFGMVVGSLAELRTGLEEFIAGHDPAGRQYRGNVRAGKPALSAFLDEDLRAALASWIEKRKYEKLLELWVQGLQLDWRLLHREQQRSRISLPVYPFARSRYWVPGVAPAVATAPAVPTAPPVTTVPAAGARAAAAGVVLLHPVWRDQALTGPGSDATPECRLLLCGVDAVAGVEAVVHDCAGADAGARFEAAAAGVFDQLQGLVREKLRAPVLVQVVTPLEGEGATFAALAAMLKTAQLENPHIRTQQIALSAAEPLPEILAGILATERTQSDAAQVRYRAGRRQVLRLEELPHAEKAVHPWREDGVYLITGGAGAVGLIFARAILRETKRAIVVLTGRRPEAAELPRDDRIVYRQLDVADAQAVQTLVAALCGEFGHLTGILHSAGVLRDAYLLKKVRSDFDAVLAPKVRGLVNLDLASRDLPLDLFVAFSSLAGVTGNPGQVDYAGANAFLDQYAAYRNTLVLKGQRSGRSLSLNWPLWAEGGMRPDVATIARMREQFGLEPMPSDAGIAAFYQALVSGKDQVLVATGARGRILDLFGSKPLPASEAEPFPGTSTEASSDPLTEPSTEPSTELSDRVRAKLRQFAAQLIKVAPEVIELDVGLSEYGYDSVSMTELINKLNDTYDLDLAPTLCFEYPTLAALADHLVAAHQPVFARHHAAVRMPAARVKPALPMRPAPTVAASGPEALAIVGISCCMPMAADVDAFWANLMAERDCIAEIPPSRWDWRALRADPDSGETSLRWGGFIDDVDQFDPLFFGISPREAEMMDPQQRLLMMHVWKALEDAGYAAQRVSGSRTALFVGVGQNSYSTLFSAAQRALDGYSATAGVPSIGPNRMSYFLNLHGPSEPIETACSSSLVAISRGVAVLRDGSCDMAIVGGVNLLVTPEAHLSFSRAGMLSPDGRCKSFSAQANGYVRGEGIGMLVLKRLSDAERDGDHVYALIRGCAENHGGRASSLTAPNPAAQAAVLQETYRNAGVDPRSVSYIEAHGTGTKLGDPIEISGLKTAFGETGEQAFCGLGSVKSNIGHLELAAGVAGVIKVLLQMQHKTLVKSLHCEEANPLIGLAGSPFYLVQKSAPWVARTDAAGRELPRRAGVSSFGFGGVNAHVLLEEYVPSVKETPFAEGSAALIVLSARSAESLSEIAARLLSFLQGRAQPPAALASIAYTLQVGRDAMDERLGWSVSSLAELIANLQAFVASGALCGGMRGQVKRNKEALSALAGDEDTQALLDSWIAKGKHARLLDVWSKGVNIDWERLYPNGKPQRLSLPSYPFARQRYWAPAKVELQTGALLHPLLHANTSDFGGQRFSSHFSGDEFFLADHKVQGKAVLPAVAYLEMARAAIAQTVKDCPGIVLTNVVWARPFMASATPVAIHVALAEQDDGRIAFEIFSDGEESVLHSRGLAELRAAPAQPRLLDLTALEHRMTRGKLSGAQCYAAFSSMGMAYGPGHRGISVLHGGESEALARLSLPLPGAGYELPPGLLDSAIQASLGLMLAEGDGLSGTGTMLPFAVNRVELLAPCASEMWAWVFASGNTFDVALCDEAGRVCVSLDGISTRQLAGAATATATAAMPAAPAAPPRSLAAGELQERVRAALLQTASSLIKVRPEDIDSDGELSEYGFDSISLTELANKLNLEYELELMPTLFFEYTSIDELAGYLVEVHGEVFARRYSPQDAHPEPEQTPQPPPQSTPGLAQPGTGARRKMRSAPAAADLAEAIAIVGMSGRMPMADDLDAFWNNLVEGQDCISEIPPSRWDWKEFVGDAQLQGGKTNVRWAGFIDGIDQFDPQFFGITPREAEVMDPQQRLLMLYVWKAIEDAGYAAQALSGSRTALFVGTGASSYGNVLAKSASAADAFSATAIVASIGPNRMSYFLDLHGPSEPIETACSSSLVAINRGVAVLRDGTSDMAIVGGVNTIVSPHGHISFDKAGMLSPDGRCKTFSAQANGYVRGEGVGMLVLKRLSDAERDGDHVYALIRGCAENHGGRASSLTAPNPVAQAALLKEAYGRAGVDPCSVSYIEAHGTGTKLGDPVEISGLKTAFGETGEQAFCGLGSVKSNIGHLELAAGVAGVIKVLLQMQHKTLVKSLHCEEINPYIELAGSPFYLVQKNTPWRARTDAAGRELPRRAGVSSFGFGGVNAHVVLEEYVATAQATQASPHPALIVLSARNAECLPEMAANLLAFLRAMSVEGDAEQGLLTSLAYTLQVGRDAMDERLGWVVSSLAALMENLQSFVADGTLGSGVRGQARRNREAVALLGGDDDTPALLGAWLAKGKYVRLLDMWSKGLVIDWEMLYAGARPRRLALPTYPFALGRYWADAASAQSVPADALADAPADAPAALAGVIACVARLSGLPAEEISDDSELHALGLDSVALLQLAAALTSAFPVLDRQKDGDALLRCASVGALADYIERAGSPPSATLYAFVPPVTPDMEPVAPAHRPASPLCDELRIESAEPLCLSARLVVDESHPFFFDHPLDHVSGLHLGAAMSEAVHAAHIYRHGLAPATALFVSTLALDFAEICRKEPAASVRVASAPGEGCYEASVSQEGCVTARANLMVQACEPRLPGAPAPLPVLRPACQRRLNKRNAANVLLSEVAGSALRPGAWLLPPSGPCFFTDFPGDRVDVVVLAEAARQGLRLFFDDAEERQEAAQLDLLKKLEVRLQRPIYWDEGVYLELVDHDRLKIGSATRLHIDGAFVVGGVAVGSFSASALSVSGALQEHWGRQERNPGRP